jgi:N-acyl-phosphatidylethanolamine-hydrolysing phospholipase D
MVWEVQFRPGHAAQKVDANMVIPQVTPTFGVGSKASQIKATWLGHACYLVEMPSVDSQKGVTVLFDPVFSQRCSPFSFMGPGRFTRE